MTTNSSSNENGNSPSNLWTRRSQSNNKLSLSMNNKDRASSSNDSDAHTPSTSKRFGSLSRGNTLNSLSGNTVQSPTASGASSAFGLGSGAFARFGSGGSSGGGKTPTAKTPSTSTGNAFSWGENKRDKDSQGSSEEKEKDRDGSKRPPARKSLSSFRTSTPTGPEAPQTPAKEISAKEWPLKHTWVVYYRPPTTKNADYEASIKPLCRIPSAQAFWKVYVRLNRPSTLPTVSDYHIFREGIRPVWEDEANRAGGKWILRLKKGVADRYWEELLLAMVGDQFNEASDEVCGAVVSVRSGEDVLSIWTKQNGGRNVRVRETLKRILSLPADTVLQFKSHDASIEQRAQADQARQEKTAAGGGAGALYNEKRRNTMRGGSSAPVEEDEGKA